MALQEHLLAIPDGPESLPVWDHFCEGCYVRQLYLPPGFVAIGEIHRYDTVNIVLGEIVVSDEDGKRHLQGFNVFHSRAGLKRAVQAISGTMWLTVHANPENERDSERMADRLTVPSFEELDSLANPPNVED